MTLRDDLADPSPEVRAAACRSLRGARSLHALRLLAAGLDDPHDGVVTAAAEVLMETPDAGPLALVAFHPKRAARRVAVRLTQDIDLLYLLLADAETRAETIERLRFHPPIGRTDERAAILRRLLTDGTLPAEDAARLFRDDPDSLALLALQLVHELVSSARGEPEIVYERPTYLEGAFVPSSFVAIVELLDAVPGAWRATLSHRHLFRDGGTARMAFLSWLSLTAHAARHHAARRSWNADALAIESTTMPALLLSEEIPLNIRRDALRSAAGLTGQQVDPAAFGWDSAFVLSCLFNEVSHRDSGAHDLRAAYALLDVRSAGAPFKGMQARLGTAAIVRAAREGAADLAWMIGATPLGRTDHWVAEDWLVAIAAAEPRAFVEITRTLPLPWWVKTLSALTAPVVESLLNALADSDAPPATWSTWAAAMTGSQPSAGAMLEQRGYRIVRPGTPAFPGSLSKEQERSADRIGVPAVIEHRASGIVFVLIPGGEFLMGGPDTDPEAYEREKPARLVTVETFYLAVTPVTQGQWSGSELPFHDDARVPARGINWTQATAFVKSLGMRLPTEAEWERAARADTTTRYWWGDAYENGRANCQSELARPAPAGRFPANPWGLIDILGNVWEWCQESYSDAKFSMPRWRVLRGGSWYAERWNVRASERYWGEQDGADAMGTCGVRPALDLSICFETPPAS